MADRPLSDLPKFLQAVVTQSVEAGSEAANAAALLLVRGLRAELPTRRLRSSAVLGERLTGTGVALKGKRTGTGVNYAYLDSDPAQAKTRPTAAVFGRGPVHLLENPIRPHQMTRTVIRRPAGGRGKPPTIKDITARRGGAGIGRKRGTAGPTLGEVGFTSGTITTSHPGVQRTSGPFERGLAKHGTDAMRRWQTTFAKRSTEVKF